MQLLRGCSDTFTLNRGIGGGIEAQRWYIVFSRPQINRGVSREMFKLRLRFLVRIAYAYNYDSLHFVWVESLKPHSAVINNYRTDGEVGGANDEHVWALLGDADRAARDIRDRDDVSHEND